MNKTRNKTWIFKVSSVSSTKTNVFKTIMDFFKWLLHNGKLQLIINI